MGKLIPGIPSWKYYLSYITEFLLESYSSEQNGHIELFLSKGRLMLCAENAIYSFDDLYLNFSYAFEKVEERWLKGIDSVLVLGMGLASIPLILEKKWKGDYRFSLVEYDETIAILAQKYNLKRLKNPVQLWIQDAEIFVKTCSDRFDLICVDLYKDQYVPDAFKAAEFLMYCKERLNSGGILIYNAPGNTEEERKDSEQFFNNIFLAVFEEGKSLSLHKNCMLFSR